MNYLKTSIRQPANFLGAGHCTNLPGWKHEKKQLNCFTFFICITGKIHIQEENIQYTLTPGDCLCTYPEHIYFGYAPSLEASSYYWLVFNPSDSHSILNEEQLKSELQITRNNPLFSKINDAILIPKFKHNSENKRYNVLLRQILHIVQSNYYTHKAVDYLTTSLFIELTNEIFEVKEKNSAPPSPEQERLERILSIIDLQLYKNPSLRYISDMLNYNQDYLSRFFKKHMGMSIKQYIHLQQMEEAKKLLLQTNDTIKEIAYHIGFTDEKYFVRIFKKEEGITPSQYRYSYYQGLQS